MADVTLCGLGSQNAHNLDQGEHTCADRLGHEMIAKTKILIYSTGAPYLNGQLVRSMVFDLPCRCRSTLHGRPLVLVSKLLPHKNASPRRAWPFL